MNIPQLFARRAFRGAAFGSLAVLAALGTTASCGEGAPESGSTTSVRDPLAVVRAAEARLMFQEAAQSPPEVTDRGLLVRSIRLNEAPTRSARWATPRTDLSVEVAPAGTMVVSGGRHRATVMASRIDGQSSTAAREGAAVVTRDSAGDVRAALLARSTGVEDLIYKTDARQLTGYELDLPEGWSLRQPAGFAGLVEIRDRSNKPRLRILARVAWDATGRRFPVAARVDGRQVTFSVSDEAELPVVIDPEWQDTNTPAIVRSRATSTLLQDGRVIVIGGMAGSDDPTSDGGDVLCSTEIYSPFDLTWEAGPPIQAAGDAECTPLMEHAAVPLPDGTVLVTGGANLAARLGVGQPAALNQAWRFDPKQSSFSRLGAMNEPRVHHTVSLIPSPDPVSNPDGWQVLIAGGQDRLTPFSESGTGCNIDGCRRCVGTKSAEVFDASGKFTKMEMDLARACHSATVLKDGSVMLIGGGSDVIAPISKVHGTPVSAISVFRPGSGFETLSTELHHPRFAHVAVHRPDTNKILVALGRDETCLIGLDKSKCANPGATDEIIDVDAVLSANPPADAITEVACGETCRTPRSHAAGILNRDGTVLLAGGQEEGVNETVPSDEANIFNFESLGFEDGAPRLLSPASKPVLTNLPTGNTLLVGLTAPSELLPDNEWAYQDDQVQLSFNEPRTYASATLLPDGTVLIAGGLPGSTASLATTEIFDPMTLALTAGPTMTTPRAGHTATFLPPAFGKPARVLITGGMPQPGDLTVTAIATAEQLEIGGGFSPIAMPMHHPRGYHSAIRLPSGKVLIVGDHDAHSVAPPSAELFDPETDEFIELPAPAQARAFPLVTLLPNGNVLIAGGFTGINLDGAFIGELSSAEVFDPSQGEHGEFRPTGNMIVPRGFGSATPLANGMVLMAGGSPSSATAELYDPDTETFSLANGIMNQLRLSHSATMLPSGKVLLSGGAVAQRGVLPHNDSEIFDPSTEQFETIPGAATTPGRWDQPSMLLPNGSVALFGGTPDAFNLEAMASISILAPQGTPVAPDPGLLSAPVDAVPGDTYPVAGSELTRYWGSSSGPYASHAGAPIAVWVPIAGAPVAGTFAPFTGSGASWTPPSSPYQGQGILYTSLLGQIGKPGVPVTLAKAPNGIPCVSDSACDSGFCSDGVCCDDRCNVPGEEGRACRACSVAMGAEVDGVCSFVDEGTDPHDECPKAPECSERFAVCGGDGQCKPCTCESNLDCAEGYVCSASGSCEEPPTVMVGGCSTSRSQGSPTAGLPLLAAVAALLRRRRRTSPQVCA